MIGLSQIYSLPYNWEWAKLKDVSNIKSGYGLPKKYQGKTKDEIPFFKVKDISNSALNHNIYLKIAENYISQKECEEIRAKPLRKGTIVFAKIGEAIRLNRRAILNQDSLVDNNVMGVYPNPNILLNKYVYYYFLTLKLENYGRATTVPSLRKTDIENINLPLPPIEEQRFIVNKIEQLLTELDAGIESLKKAKEMLQKYRQSVLKSAFEGKLVTTEVELTKTENRDYESGDELLERILKEHEDKSSNKKKSKTKESQKIDTSDLPALPEGWVWTKVGDIYNITGGGTPSTKVPEYWNGNIPWITSADITGLKKTEPKKYINQKAIDNSSTKLVPENSILVVTRVGLGKIAITKYPICFNQDIQALTENKSLINPDYALYYLSDEVNVFKHNSRGTTIDGVTKKQLYNLKFPLPPLVEQQRIADEIERCLSVADETEKTIDNSLEQAENLRQSILKKAFEGRLVPQNPDDEPASALLEKIKEEKEKQENKSKSKSKKETSKNKNAKLKV